MKFALPAKKPAATVTITPPYLDVTVTKVPDHEGVPVPVFVAKVLLPSGHTLDFPVLLNEKPESKVSGTTVNLSAAAAACVQITKALSEGLTYHIKTQLDAVNPSGTKEVPYNYTYGNLFGDLYSTPKFSPSIGGTTGSNVLKTLAGVFPGLDGATAKSPCKCEVAKAGLVNLGQVVIHLNDTHQWTRDRIADWLDTLDIDLSAKPNTEKESAA